MNKQDIQTVLDALQNSQLFVQASSNINVLEGFGQQLDDADEAIALLRAALAEPESEAKPYCPYCESDNKGMRSTYFDQTCEGCVKRMTAPSKPALAEPSDPVMFQVTSEIAHWKWQTVRDEAEYNEYTVANKWKGRKLFTHPASKPAPLPELTDAEILQHYNWHSMYQEEGPYISGWFDFARAILAAAREKANG